MNTPITDAVYPPEIIDREFKAQGRTYGWGTLHDMREVSRRLELDRAALMEALERIAGICEIKRDKWIAKFIEEALSTASANFPES